MVHSKEQNKLTEPIPNEAQILDSLEKSNKTIVLNMFKELKENINKEQKETRKAIYTQNDTVIKEIESIKRNQTEILELKSTITEMEL